MTSPISTTRLTLLPSNYLASQVPSSEVTLQSLIDVSDQMADEAKEALPYSFSECSYGKGYVRQSVWSCLDCGGKGVCYGCSISCHGEHKLVELWTRRDFRCDCPTITMQPEPQPGVRRRRCALNPPTTQPALPNERNRYTKNFEGKFCRCGREYDPETEAEAMLCCIACEDWLHESCLNLHQPSSTEPKGTELASLHLPTPVTLTGISEDLDEDLERARDEDDDETSLIPSDTYDGLICAECAKANPFVRAQAGQEGWMIIEPDEEGWKVVGNEDTPETSDTAKMGEKRPLNDEPEKVTAKKAKVELDESAQNIQVVDEASWPWKGKGDIFLGHGVREKLLLRSDYETIAKSVPFPLKDEDAYEPPQEDVHEETVEEATDRVVSSLPRVQAIEALHGYQRLKEKLNDMLREHVESGQTVRKEDIEELFEQLKRAQRA